MKLGIAAGYGGMKGVTSRYFFAGGIDGGSSAITEATDIRLLAASTYHFTSLVCCCCQQRCASEYAGCCLRRLADVSHDRAGWHQLRQRLRLDGQCLPFPVQLTCPFQTLVVKMADNRLAKPMESMKLPHKR